MKLYILAIVICAQSDAVRLGVQCFYDETLSLPRAIGQFLCDITFFVCGILIGSIAART